MILNKVIPVLAGLPVGTGGFLHPESIVNEFNVEEGMSIADFGCGSGYFTIYLAEKVGSGGKVYALDVQEHALDSVRARANAEGLANVETIRTNLEIIGSSGLPDNSQDIVLLANILFQSQKRGEIIREGSRVLKSGGRMIIIDWKRGSNGLGPPDGTRPDKNELNQLAQKEKLTFEKDLDAGNFHFGLIFKK